MCLTVQVFLLLAYNPLEIMIRNVDVVGEGCSMLFACCAEKKGARVGLRHTSAGIEMIGHSRKSPGAISANAEWRHTSEFDLFRTCVDDLLLY